MSELDIRLCVLALYENLMEGMIADLRYQSDFARAEIELEQTFRAFLSESNG